MEIRAARDIRAEMAGRGYSLLRAAELHISDEMMQDWLSLSIDFASLPQVEHSQGGAQIFRRFGRFCFSPESGELARLSRQDYSVGADISPAGENSPDLPPLLDTTFDNPFLRELIRFDFACFPLARPMRREPWEAHVHLIRVKAAQDEPALESIRHDSARFVSVYLAELVNAKGGVVSIYGDKRQLLAQFRLEQVLDSYRLDASRLGQAADPIRPLDPAHGAIRSMLVIAFHFPAGADAYSSD